MTSPWLELFLSDKIEEKFNSKGSSRSDVDNLLLNSRDLGVKTSTLVAGGLSAMPRDLSGDLLRFSKKCLRLTFNCWSLGGNFWTARLLGSSKQLVDIWQ